MSHARRKTNRDDLYTAIAAAEIVLEEAERAYLLHTGWRQPTRADGWPATWSWEKVLPDGRTVLADTYTAVKMQSALDGMGS